MKKYILFLLLAMGALCVLLVLMKTVKAVRSNLVEQQGRDILKHVVEANQYWLLAPPDSVGDYNYVLHLQWPNKFPAPSLWAKAPDGSVQKAFNVTDPRNAPASLREGMTYSSVLQWLAQHPELARVQSIKADSGKITLTLKFVPEPGAYIDFFGKKHPNPPLPIECGYGIRKAGSNVHSDDFATDGTNAVLVIDAQKVVPLSSVIPTGHKEAVEETFSNYTEMSPGNYVPLAVTIKFRFTDQWRKSREREWVFNSTFKLHDGLWLFDEGKFNGEKAAWTDHVVVH